MRHPEAEGDMSDSVNTFRLMARTADPAIVPSNRGDRDVRGCRPLSHVEHGCLDRTGRLPLV